MERIQDFSWKSIRDLDKMKSNLTIFCDKRGISLNIKNSFGAYLRSSYAQKYFVIGDGETIHLMIGKMTEEELMNAWQEYVKELAKWLPS